jgi:hypothetical protein
MSTRAAAEKLLIKPGGAVWSSDPERLALVDPLPDGRALREGESWSP